MPRAGMAQDQTEPARFGRVGRITVLNVIVLTGLRLSSPAFATADRVALVIGNSAYQHMPVLANPTSDAKSMAEVLSKLGFENGQVQPLLDLDLRALLQAIRAFGERARDAKVAVIYFSGHGLQLSTNDGTESYLLPVDADLSDALDVPRQTLALHELLAQASHTQGAVIALLDACRNNPTASHISGSGSRGATRSGLIPIAQSSLKDGVVVSYATSGGDAAEDGSGRHSPYATALIKYLPTPGMDISQVLRRVRRDVVESTGEKQKPEIVDNLNVDVFLASLPAPTQPPPQPGPDPLEAEKAYWMAMKDSSHPEDFESYLLRYPEGLHADFARNRLALLRQPPPMPAIAPKVDVSVPVQQEPPRPDVEGRVAGVFDSTAIRASGRTINLYGITDPLQNPDKISQVRQVMKEQLAALGNVIKCYSRDNNTFECYAQDQDIAELAVKNGIARALPSAPAKYHNAEQEAKMSHRGLWRGPA
jgi:hypothetical protein